MCLKGQIKVGNFLSRGSIGDLKSFSLKKILMSPNFDGVDLRVFRGRAVKTRTHLDIRTSASYFQCNSSRRGETIRVTKILKSSKTLEKTNKNLVKWQVRHYKNSLVITK